MSENAKKLSRKQSIYRDIVLGTLVYAVVLGFFNDYTNILLTDSYSTTFLAAIILQVLTFLTFELKRAVAKWFKARPGMINKIGLFVSVWLILFLSKFVFLGAIDLALGSAIEIGSVWGLMVIIAVMTVVKEGLDAGFRKLAD